MKDFGSGTRHERAVRATWFVVCSLILVALLLVKIYAKEIDAW
jgi:hypothetical protein